MSLQGTFNQGVSAIAGAIQHNRQIKAIERSKAEAASRQEGLNIRSQNSLQATQLRHDIIKMRHDMTVLKMANQRAKIEKELKEQQKKEFVERMKAGKAKAAAFRTRMRAGE